MLILLGVVLGVAAFLAWRAWRISSLNWPRNITFPAFRSRVRWLLKKHHWSVAEPLVHPSPLVVTKGSLPVLIICLHDTDSMTPMKLSDLGGNQKLRGMKQVVCITGKPFSEALRQEALQKRIYLLYYKQLKSFVSLPSSETKTIKGYFENSYKF